MDDRPLSPAGEVPVMPLRQSHRRAKSVRSSAHAPNPSRPVDSVRLRGEKVGVMGHHILAEG